MSVVESPAGWQAATDVLVAARALLARPGGWTRGIQARDARSNPVGIADPEAVSFCAFGALGRVAPRRDGRAYLEAVDRLTRELGPRSEDDPATFSIAAFNDEQPDVAPVLALFDRALAREASGGQIR